MAEKDSRLLIGDRLRQAMGRVGWLRWVLIGVGAVIFGLSSLFQFLGWVVVAPIALVLGCVLLVVGINPTPR